jgi:hypothetical protein
MRNLMDSKNERPQTLEYFRHTYLEDGMKGLVSEIRKLHQKSDLEITNKNINQWIKAVLYGANKDGGVRDRPPAPDPNDLNGGHAGQDKYRFEKVIFRIWNEKQKKADKR